MKDQSMWELYRENMAIADRTGRIEKPTKIEMIEFLAARKIIKDIREVWAKETHH